MPGLCYNGPMLTDGEAERLLAANHTLQVTNATLIAATARPLALVRNRAAPVAAAPLVKPSTPRPAPTPSRSAHACIRA